MEVTVPENLPDNFLDDQGATVDEGAAVDAFGATVDAFGDVHEFGDIGNFDMDVNEESMSPFV